MSATFIKLLCLLPLALCSEPKDWGFVQSVGGIELGAPSLSEEKWSLAVRADVSGLNEITVKPSLVNSALICQSTSAAIQGQSIFLTIHTGLLREGYSTTCPPANLGKLDEGSYQVLYQGPNGEPRKLGEILLRSAPAVGNPGALPSSPSPQPPG